MHFVTRIFFGGHHCAEETRMCPDGIFLFWDFDSGTRKPPAGKQEGKTGWPFSFPGEVHIKRQAIPVYMLQYLRS